MEVGMWRRVRSDLIEGSWSMKVVRVWVVDSTLERRERVRRDKRVKVMRWEVMVWVVCFRIWVVVLVLLLLLFMVVVLMMILVGFEGGLVL